MTTPPGTSRTGDTAPDPLSTDPDVRQRAMRQAVRALSVLENQARERARCRVQALSRPLGELPAGSSTTTLSRYAADQVGRFAAAAQPLPPEILDVRRARLWRIGMLQVVAGLAAGVLVCVGILLMGVVAVLVGIGVAVVGLAAAAWFVNGAAGTFRERAVIGAGADPVLGVGRKADAIAGTMLTRAREGLRVTLEDWERLRLTRGIGTPRQQVCDRILARTAHDPSFHACLTDAYDLYASSFLPDESSARKKASMAGELDARMVEVRKAVYRAGSA